VKASANQPTNSQEYQMNQQFGNSTAAPKTSYDRAQSALGGPVPETLQVDESIISLGDAVEFHVETVRALLRRLQPVTSDLCEAVAGTTCVPQSNRVDVARRIHNQRDELQYLTSEVQNIIRALQI
jgi:hypothetical protein